VGFHENTSRGEENVKDPNVAEECGETEGVGCLALQLVEAI